MVTIDGLICSRMDRTAILDTLAGGIDCVTVTCGFWEDATESMDAVVRWGELVTANSDVATLVRHPADIDRAARDGRLAIILGFQNSAFLQGRLGFVELFKKMDVHVAQLTYNTQNDVGGSCYEPQDSGLTRFGLEVVEEMNRVGMVIDLSHVGDRTSLEAIENSGRGVAITHANPRSLVDHPRNKPDDVLRALEKNGGMLGVTTYHNITRGYHGSVDEWAGMVARTVDLIGVGCVGIGTDLNQGGDDGYRRWMRNGRWSRREQHGAALGTPVQGRGWYDAPGSHREILPALLRRGFDEQEADQLLGGNWRRFYDENLLPAGVSA